MKYQFCIRFNDIDVNSASSKAVLDCNAIFLKKGYRDFTLTVPDNSNRARYYPLLLKSLFVFFFNLRSRSAVAVQYPLLSINNVFKYFVAAARLKKISFFCIVHDLHSLRTGGNNEKLIRRDIKNLNRFDSVIVHNKQMLNWLTKHGLKTKTVILEVFDYLSEDFTIGAAESTGEMSIVYAGNLIKSTFIYKLYQLKNCRFNIYGPGYNPGLAAENGNVTWCGQYPPGQIAKELQGNFGLIWDGESCDACDEVLGNYLKYNAPHKFSLYIAAGIPVIAPADSAIGDFIKARNIGILINSIHDLESLTPDPRGYALMKTNVLVLRNKIINGNFFTTAVQEVEAGAAI